MEMHSEHFVISWTCMVQ